MTGHEPPPESNEDKRKAHRKPIFARSCRSAQSGNPTTPREVHLPLLPHRPGGVHKHLPRRTRLRRSAGPEENRPVPLDQLSFLQYPKNGLNIKDLLSQAEHHHFTTPGEKCQARYLPMSRLYFSFT